MVQERSDAQEFRFSRPIVRVGQDFSLGENETVREIQSGLADITIAGQVENDVVVIVGSLHLRNTAKIGGSVLVIGGTLTDRFRCVSGRDMIVIGGSLNAPAEFTPGGQQVVIGNIGVANTLHGVRALGHARPVCSGGPRPGHRWMWPVVGIFFFIYLMVNALFAATSRSVADTVTARPLSSFLLGLLVLVLVVPAIAILAATVVGIAVVPFVLCGLVMAGTDRQGRRHARDWPHRGPEDEDAGRCERSSRCSLVSPCSRSRT